MDDNKNQSQNKGQNQNKNKKRGPQVSLTWIYMVIAITLGYLLMNGDSSLLSGGSSRNATYSQFKSYVEQGYASRIIVNKKEGSLLMYVEPSHANRYPHCPCWCCPPGWYAAACRTWKTTRW